MTVHWQGKRVVIIGAARQGLALARYLARHKAIVTLNDRRNSEQLQAEMESLSDSEVAWSLGGHPLELLDHADLLCISGGIPLENPLVVAAIERDLPVSNDTQVFMEAVPCRTLGITGSAGKTTTTTLVGRMAQADTGGKYRKVWIGGNIGDPLINYVDEMDANDLAILEISSFQSEQMTKSPNIAAILNITPNHLDRHGTMEAYTAAKARLLGFQQAGDVAILNRDDPGSWGLAAKALGKLFSFGLAPLPDGADGAYVDGGRFFLRDNGKTLPLDVAEFVMLRGEHNRLNALAACAISHAAGISPQAMLDGVKDFRGVPHRLEYVRSWRGAQWYNDSIATAPERTIAAIRSFGGPMILLLGGRDKNLPWDELGKLVRQRVDHVVIFGEAAEKIQESLGARILGSKPYSVTRVAACKDAVTAASRLAQPGFVVLFSPGATSFDEFKDFEERGERFKQWVQEFSETLR